MAKLEAMARAAVMAEKSALKADAIVQAENTQIHALKIQDENLKTELEKETNVSSGHEAVARRLDTKITQAKADKAEAESRQAAAKLEELVAEEAKIGAQ